MRFLLRPLGYGGYAEVLVRIPQLLLHRALCHGGKRFFPFGPTQSATAAYVKDLVPRISFLETGRIIALLPPKSNWKAKLAIFLLHASPLVDRTCRTRKTCRTFSSFEMTFPFSRRFAQHWSFRLTLHIVAHLWASCTRIKTRNTWNGCESSLARLSTFDPCFNFFHVDKLLCDEWFLKFRKI